jgi:hypothetical protein
MTAVANYILEDIYDSTEWNNGVDVVSYMGIIFTQSYCTSFVRIYHYVGRLNCGLVTTTG